MDLQRPGPDHPRHEGDRVRVSFRNLQPSALMHLRLVPGDGRPSPARKCARDVVYEFDAIRLAFTLSRHTVRLKRHIHGPLRTFIVDPRSSSGSRPPADEFVMVMNAFDTTFDAENEVYAVNTVANVRLYELTVTVGKLVRFTRQRHRVRSSQQPAPARHVLRRTAPAPAHPERQDRHNPTPARASGRSWKRRSAISRLHVPRAPERVRGGWMGCSGAEAATHDAWSWHLSCSRCSRSCHRPVGPAAVRAKTTRPRAAHVSAPHAPTGPIVVNVLNDGPDELSIAQVRRRWPDVYSR